jgi:GT2 family glycosyltransferase
MASSGLSVVIPNWNGRQWLDGCLASLRRQTLAPGEIIVVDDGSTDGSVEFLAKHYPEVKVVARTANGGFCKAANDGIGAAVGEAILLLNNDTELHPDCLQVLAKALAQFPEVDFFAPCMLQAGGGLIDSAGVGISKRGRLYPRSYGEPAAEALPFREGEKVLAEPVFGNSAGAGLYRRRLFEDIGLFDEDFFMYLEDVDLDFRSRLRRHRCLYLPQAGVFHLGSATLGASNPRVTYLLIRNRLLVLAKSLPGGLLLKHFPALVAEQIRSGVFYAAQGKATLFLRALFGGLGRLPGFMSKRRAIQSARAIGNRELEELLIP